MGTLTVDDETQLLRQTRRSLLKLDSWRRFCQYDQADGRPQRSLAEHRHIVKCNFEGESDAVSTV